MFNPEKDEQWPSTRMCEEVMKRLEQKEFSHYYEHISYNGGHAEPLDHFDEVLSMK